MRPISLLASVILLVPGLAHAQAAPTTSKAGTIESTPTPATASAPGADAPPVDVHFSSAAPGVTVYSRPVPLERLNGADAAGKPPEFAAVCQAPCDARLEPAIHEFALAPEGNAPLPVAPAFELRGDASFRADIISHESRRRTGWWILGIMGTAGITSTTIGLFQTCVDDQTCQEWTSLAIWGGMAVTTAGALLGLPMITTSDEATLTLVPGMAPLASRARDARADSERASAVPAGATFVGQF